MPTAGLAGWRTAHPRSRGENQYAAARDSLTRGSSPLTRGKPPEVAEGHPVVGLIPAHAGKTGRPPGAGAPWTAHPRSRGENRGHPRDCQMNRGSSPLTRGKRLSCCCKTGIIRLIPAHAGKTSQDPRSGRTSTAHPRSRGENVLPSPSVPPDAGSSPLTRGKPRTIRPVSSPLRLIPAHAGKTTRRNGSSRRAAAHPRSRGENPEIWSASILENGSSPLTRGKLGGLLAQARRGRLIPAHAGKTTRGRVWPGHDRAHPRSRGENAKAGHSTRASRGSSPLTRGKRTHCQEEGRCPGLIPAHAGKTRGNPRVQHCVAAHPRSRGENSQVTEGCLPGRGSSPLTRGKRLGVGKRQRADRLIPAHAGKTLVQANPRASCRAHPRSRGENFGVPD